MKYETNTKRRYGFKKTITGDVLWRISLKDPRGSVTQSMTNSFTIP